MSKKNETTQQEQPTVVDGSPANESQTVVDGGTVNTPEAAPANTEQPEADIGTAAHLSELLNTGHVTITANTREEVNALALAVVGQANASDVHVASGIVGHDIVNAQYVIELFTLKSE